jgi:hypothetical protein
MNILSTIYAVEEASTLQSCQDRSLVQPTGVR